MSNPWKAVALFAVAVVFALCGILAWAVRRGNEESARLRHNVQEQIRYHLGQKEPGKAAGALGGFPDDAEGRAAADAARVEIARTVGPDEAAALLDPIDLSNLDGVVARAVAEARFAAYRTLLADRVFAGGEPPTPYEPGAFRLKPPAPTKPEDMSRIAGRVLVCIGQSRDLAKRFNLAPDPALAATESLARIARYALGEIAFDAVKPGNDEARVLFGDLLFRERQFDRAIETWTPVLADRRVIRRLAELSMLRRMAPRTMRVWDYDVDRLLGRDASVEEEGADAVKALYAGARRGDDAPLDVFERKGLPKDGGAVTVEDDSAIFFPGGGLTETVIERVINNPTVDPDQMYLLTEHHQFTLDVPLDRPFTTRSGATLRLRSAYRGPIRTRLYQVATLDALEKLSEENLVERRGELTLVTEWETQFVPMSESGTRSGDGDLAVPHRKPGLYVAIAEARYCPVFAIAKFLVTDVALVQQVAADRVLLFAADRAGGAPVPGLALEGDVSGSFVLKPEMLVPADDSKADEYKRGFEASWGRKPEEFEATPAYKRGYERAGVLRANNPDMRAAFRGTTGAEGLFEWKVDPAWKPGYRYQVRTATTGATHYSKVETSYAADGKTAELRALVYSDRPLYRPGDEVFFKGILRTYDGEGLGAYEAREALFEVSVGGRPLFSRSIPVSDFGTASGSFTLPADCQQGYYVVRVNNQPWQMGLFRVEEYRKPEFEIVLTHPPRIVAGRPVESEVWVRRFTGEPVADAEVSVTLSSAPTPGRTMSAAAAWGEERQGDPRRRWRELERRQFKTDATGRCRYRFETEDGVPRQYAVTATVHEPVTHRFVYRSTSFEATGPMKEVRIETDRPSYVPGEIAHLRIFAEDAAAVRVEERVQGDDPFSKSIPLVNGAVAVDYPVPALNRELRVGVRDGDDWAWTPAPVAIMTRTEATGALKVRLDRSVYRVGETARVRIDGREPNQQVLLVTATGRIHHVEVLKLDGKRREVDLPIVEDDVPNVLLTAFAVHRDTLERASVEILVPPIDRFLTVNIDTDRKEYRPGDECRATVRVVDSKGRPVPQCELSLGVVDEALYALQEDTTQDLRDYFHRYHREMSVKDSFFFRSALRSFTVWKSPVFVRGLLNLRDAIGVGVGGGAGGRYGGRENLVARGGGSLATNAAYARSNFKDTAAWNAHVVTGADGTAVVAFAFPDNLTTFRFTARGITKSHQVGAVTQTAVVRKELYVRLFLPRVVQETDELTLIGLVHNYTGKPRTLKLSFASPFPLRRKDAPAELTVEAGGVGRVRYTVAFDRYLADPEFRFAAVDGAEAADEVVLVAPGRRHGLPFVEGRSGSIATQESREEVFRIPANAIPGTIAVKITLDAGLHGAIVEALEPLIQYPYGCVEQTMSRFLPAVVADRALNGAPNRWSEKLPTVLAAGLRRLYQHQHPPGDWGWWQHDQGSPAMTAYVLFGLAHCKKAGVGVDREATLRGAKWLREIVDRNVFQGQPFPSGPVPLGMPVDAVCFAMLALAEVESAWGLPTVATKQLMGAVLERAGDAAPINRILLALACRRLGMNEDSEKLALQVENQPLRDVPTAAFLLQLQATRGGETAPAIRTLLNHRVGKSWRGTMESAMAILGLAAVLDRPGAAPGRVIVQANGGPAREITLPDRVDPSFDGRLSLPEPPEGWGGKAVVRLKFEGQGTAFYTATLEAMIGGEEPASVNRGIEIDRAYYVRDRDAWKPAYGQVAPGIPVLVHLTLQTSTARQYVMVTDPRPAGFEPTRDAAADLSSQEQSAIRLTDVVDLRDGWQPRLDRFRASVRGDAGRESAWAHDLLREILETRRFQPVVNVATSSMAPGPVPASIEHRDDRTILFLGDLQPGITNLYYVVRPELAGSVHALPPHATAMYEPEIHGSGLESRLDVTEVPRGERGPATLPLPPGVEGLVAILPKLGRIDADVLIESLPANPRIGELLLRVADRDAVRAWLSIETATTAAGEGLRERIEAARRDLATRRLCVDAMESIPALPLTVLEEALSDDRLEKRALQGKAPAEIEALDNVLAWIREDREYRLALLAAAQRVRFTRRVQEHAFRPVTVSSVLQALGSRAPAGDALVRWKLVQQGRTDAETLGEFIVRCDRDLGLTIRLVRPSELRMDANEASLAQILDRSLWPEQLYYVVRDGELRIGPLDRLMR